MDITVFTGDIVASSDMDADRLDVCLATLSEGCDRIAEWTGATGHASFARRGGDGWQAVFPTGIPTHRAALFLQARLRQQGDDIATRIAIATGEGRLSDPTDPNSGHGTVFTASGRLLTRLKGKRLLGDAAGGVTQAFLRLADHIAQGWTPAQARAVAAMLPPGAGPRVAAAKKLGVSRQAVDQALHAAGYPALIDALELIETKN
ncbi:MarR family transcriptional regulator [Thalassococcus sp. CAU 1522]|uniref:MarR family transcriptional regulator n=1 Tax=Thalassococcus arenae TaxID=2851652 RepID=A0ABS6N9I2_9RHOB|nr:MarR family transcriptional regulator [Thalassococcus arenae]MBV2360671.1 MarR family transcriptional regulator [Thalassococcus arenae]